MITNTRLLERVIPTRLSAVISGCLSFSWIAYRYGWVELGKNGSRPSFGLSGMTKTDWGAFVPAGGVTGAAASGDTATTAIGNNAAARVRNLFEIGFILKPRWVLSGRRCPS